MLYEKVYPFPILEKQKKKKKSDFLLHQGFSQKKFALQEEPLTNSHLHKNNLRNGLCLANF